MDSMTTKTAKPSAGKHVSESHWSNHLGLKGGFGVSFFFFWGGGIHIGNAPILGQDRIGIQ